MTDWRPASEAVPDGTICKVRMQVLRGLQE